MPPKYDLKTGYPHAAIAPLERLSAIASEVIMSGRGFQYGGDLQGHSGARQQIAGFLAAEMAIPVDSSQLMLTTGALTAIDIVCRTLTQAGDIVVVEDPTFFFAVNLLRMSRSKVVGVPMLPDGLDLEALRGIIAQNPGKVRLVYTIPSFQNPTGFTTSAEHREALVAMAQESNFHILEDATYQPLYFGEPPPPPLKAYNTDDGRVITVASLSKLLMPSLRFGWVWALPEQIRQFIHFKSDAASSRLVAEIVTQFMTETPFGEQIASAREVYRRKHDHFTAALRDHAPAWLDWHVPHGGFFIWAVLPEPLTASDALEVAQKRGLDFFAGKGCYVEPMHDRAIRLCFALLEDDQLYEAGRMFCEVVREIGVSVRV